MCGIITDDTNEETVEEENDESEKHNHSKKTILLSYLQRAEFLDLKTELKEKKLPDIFFQELVKVLQNRYNTIFNMQTERHRFFSRTQNRVRNTHRFSLKTHKPEV